jgi:hypothetical protein
LPIIATVTHVTKDITWLRNALRSPVILGREDGGVRPEAISSDSKHLRDVVVSLGHRLRENLLARVGLAALVGALASLVVAAAVGPSQGREGVLCARTFIPSGAIITARDLCAVSTGGVPSQVAVPASARDAVLGMFAAHDIYPGTVISPRSLSRGPVGDGKWGYVGLALKPDQAPGSLRAGQLVDLYTGLATGVSSQGQESVGGALGALQVANALVVSVTPSPQGSQYAMLATVRVPASEAAALSVSASEDAVVVVGR